MGFASMLLRPDNPALSEQASRGQIDLAIRKENMRPREAVADSAETRGTMSKSPSATSSPVSQEGCRSAEASVLGSQSKIRLDVGRLS
jgi:hypothetical protein